MTTRLMRTGTVTAVATAAAVALTAGPSQAAPTNGCPAGYQLLSVADLSQRGYQVPAQMDDPNSGYRSFGQAGNGNGLVCAVPLGNQTTNFGDQLYNFMDDSLPA
jgi:hypothetical protein